MHLKLNNWNKCNILSFNVTSFRFKINTNFTFCRWGRFFLNVKWFVLWLCIFGFVEGAAVNGVVNIALTTLERQYKLPSSQSALIVSSTDIGAVLFVLLVSYFGAKGNRPKWIATGSFLMAIGSFIFTIPHVASGPYEYTCKNQYTCNSKTPCFIYHVYQINIVYKYTLHVFFVWSLLY